MANDDSLVMHFDSAVAGSPATLLVDTGASHAYRSKRCIQRMGISVRSSKATSVTLAASMPSSWDLHLIFTPWTLYIEIGSLSM